MHGFEIANSIQQISEDVLQLEEDRFIRRSSEC